MKLHYLLVLLFIVSCSNGEQSVRLFSEVLNRTVSNVTILTESQIKNPEGLICQSNDTETFSIGKWFFPDGKTVEINTDPLYILHQPGSVTLYRKQGLEGVEGIYTCKIPDTTNRTYVLYAGLYTQTNYQNGKPSFPSQPSFNLKTPLSHFPPSFTITCTSTMFPPTQVNWTRDGEAIEESDFYHMSQILVNATLTTFDNILEVNNSDLSGVYTCSVGNLQNMAAINYTVTAPLSPPTNITPEFLGSGNVKITWDPPEGPINGYQLFYEKVNGSNSDVKEVVNITGSNVSYVTLFSLQAAATYVIYMLAYADLPSELSDSIYVTLNVAGSPENITVDGSSFFPRTLDIDWDPPLTGSSSVVGYIVDYEPWEQTCMGIKGGSLQTSEEGVTLMDLEEDTTYIMRVRTVSTAAVGEPSDPITGRTSIAAPNGPPLNVTVTSADPSTVNLTWSPPACLYQNGPIISYSIRRHDLTVDFTEYATIDRLNYTVSNLISFRNYSFEIAAKTQNGTSKNFSEPVYAHLIGEPRQVTSLSLDLIDIVSIKLSWQPPDPNFTPLIFSQDFNYSVEWYYVHPDQTKGDIAGNGIAVLTTTYDIENLLPNTSYRIYVYSISSYARETTGKLIDAQTSLISQVTGVTVVEVNGTAVNVTWQPLSDTQDVSYYRVYYNSSDGTAGTQNITEIPLTLKGLNNKATYFFRVAAIVETKDNVYEGPLSAEVSFSFSKTDNIKLILIIVGSVVGVLLLLVVVIAITVFFLFFLNYNMGAKYATKGEEQIELLPLRRDEIETTTPPNGRPIILGSPPTDIHAIEGQEVVLRVSFLGDPPPKLSWKKNDKEIDPEISGFLLKEGALIFPLVEVEDSGKYEVSAENSNGVTTATITLVVYPDTDLSHSSPNQEAITSIPIPISEFGQYVSSLHGNNNRRFREQFKRLQVEDEHPIIEGSVDENRPFNRNQNIIAYDKNRVQLESLPRYLDCQHDYINASYIVVEEKESRRFIATQGPLDRTVVDFWRMVWQEKACAVVMLTKLQEDFWIKCSQYWPSVDSEDYGPFTVKLVKEMPHENYVIRELLVHYNTMVGNFRSRIANPTGKIDSNKKEHFNATLSTLMVTQYHYTGWTEHGKPASINSLISFYQHFISGTEGKNGPIVVHCSSGVGRTGAFITIDVALKQAKTEENIDIPFIVTNIRQQRMKMIQTLDQYMTVHDVVLEKVLCGDTRIPARDLHSCIHTLSLKNEKEGKDKNMTGFESQFDILEQVSVAPENAVCNVARQNPKKNRNPDIVSTDQWRVPLKGESPDYINATYIPGYRNNKAFIITQGPLRDTRRDFWKMIFDQNVAVIVMLSATNENGQEVCAQYWPPSEGNVEFGEYLVTIKEEWSHEGFSRKVLLVRDTQSNLLRRLVQFQINGWSNDGTTSCDIMSVVNVINLVAMIQRKNPYIPILVHCSDLVGCSSIFCATMATIDQLKSESVADVFQVVKAMRVQLPGAVTNKDQYKMIHSIVAGYIDVFSTSANF